MICCVLWMGSWHRSGDYSEDLKCPLSYLWMLIWFLLIVMLYWRGLKICTSCVNKNCLRHTSKSNCYTLACFSAVKNPRCLLGLMFQESAIFEIQSECLLSMPSRIENNSSKILAICEYWIDIIVNDTGKILSCKFLLSGNLLLKLSACIWKTNMSPYVTEN